jgi:hypothetical protein
MLSLLTTVTAESCTNHASAMSASRRRRNDLELDGAGAEVVELLLRL